VKDRVAEYQTKVLQLAPHLAELGISQEKFNTMVRRGADAMAGFALDQLGDYEDRLNEIDELGLTGSQRNRAKQNAKHDILGISETSADRITAYNSELARVSDLWKRNKISADEYRKTVEALGEKMGQGPSWAQQNRNVADKQTELDAWAAKNNVSKSSQEYKDRRAETMPDFMRRMADEIKTPAQRFAENMKRIAEQTPDGMEGFRMAIKAGDIEREKYSQEMGLGQYHRFTGAEMYGSDTARETIMRSQYGAQDVQTQMLAVQKQGFANVVGAIKEKKGELQEAAL
jgi:hypothetical protein